MIGGAEGEQTDPMTKRSAQRSRERALQGFGLRALNPLHAIVRNLRMYDVENRIFEQSLAALGSAVNDAVAYERLFDLQLSGTVASLNGYMLRLDFALLAHLRALTTSLKERNIGGITTDQPLQPEHLKRFFRALWGQAEGVSASDAFSFSEARNEAFIRTSTVADATHRLQKQVGEAILTQRRLDRKTYSIVLYTRAIQYMRRVVESLRQARPIEGTLQASRIVRDLVDFARENRKQFLGLSGHRDEHEYLAYHAVNTTLMSIAMGHTLRLSREQMLELGRAALFHDIGAASIDPRVAEKQGMLTYEERVVLSQNPIWGAKSLLKTRPLELGTLKTMVSVLEARHHYHSVVVNAQGASVYMARTDLGLYGRIVRIASCFDALTSHRPFRAAYPPVAALHMMNNQMRHEFDLRLLEVFNHVVRNQIIETAEVATPTQGPSQAPAPIDF